MDEVYRTLGRDEDVAETRKPGVAARAIPGVRGAGDMGRALQIIAAEHAAVLVRELAGK